MEYANCRVHVPVKMGAVHLSGHLYESIEQSEGLDVPLTAHLPVNVILPQFVRPKVQTRRCSLVQTAMVVSRCSRLSMHHQHTVEV